MADYDKGFFGDPDRWVDGARRAAQQNYYGRQFVDPRQLYNIGGYLHVLTPREADGALRWQRASSIPPRPSLFNRLLTWLKDRVKFETKPDGTRVIRIDGKQTEVKE